MSVKEDEPKELYEAYQQECSRCGIAPISAMTKILSNENRNFNLSHYMPLTLGTHLACKFVVNLPWTEIKTIDFSYSPFNANACEALGDLIRFASQLETLNLARCGIESSGVEKLFVKLDDTELTCMNLSNCKLDDAAGVQVVRFLQQNNTIQHLDLSHNQLGSGFGTEFAKILGSNKTLLTLNLSRNELEPAETCIVPLLTGLTKNKVLLAIDLSWNNLNGNNFAEALKTVLMKNKVLEEINVEFNKISGKELGVLQVAFRKSTLKRFYLEGNPLTDEEIKNFLSAIKPKNQLTLLSLGADKWFNESCDDIIDELKKKFANLKLIYGGAYEKTPPIDVSWSGILMDRCKVVAMKPKAEKSRRDMGVFFSRILADRKETCTRDEFLGKLKEFKVDLGEELLEQIVDTWTIKTTNGGKKGKKDKKGSADQKSLSLAIEKMAECYISRHPQ